jgi:hypothetical protein
VDDDVVGDVVRGVLVGRRVERDPQVVRAKALGAGRSGEESTQWADVSTTSSRTSVPVQKSNQSPSDCSWSAPTLSNRLSVSSVPPMMADA